MRDVCMPSVNMYRNAYVDAYESAKNANVDVREKKKSCSRKYSYS